MEVLKRDGTREPVKFDKISARIKKQTYGLNEPFVDYIEVSKKVISGLYDGVTTSELDSLAAETAASMITIHPDYSILASRIALTSLYKTVDKQFSKVAQRLYDYINPKTGERAGMISDEVMEIINKNAKRLDAMIVSDRDFNFDYFGFKTLEKGYLLKIDKAIAETPQHMYMRVSVGIWKDNLEMVQKTYDMMSEGLFTHATPTLFNSGTKRPQMSSCFLIDIDDDSIPGIYKTLSDCAAISQNAGGIGMNIHKIRSKGAYIKGTNGTSNGIVPMLRVFNETARYVDQGGGKRKGSIAVYLEPWHGDVLEFLDLRKNHGKEEMRTRDLFLALWIPDLFMERVEQNGEWSLFSPNEVPDLVEAYDSDTDKKFTKLYEQYEAEGRATKTLKARDLWDKILVSQIETGTPYMLYKDSCNTKSNQKNLGTIKSSNLCIAGNQRVVTEFGYLKAEELYKLGLELTLFNGSKLVKSSEMKLRAESEDVYKITLENGMEHKVTEYHGLSVIDSKNKVKRIECKDLKVGDKIAIQTQKGLFGKQDMSDEAYLLGIYQSDGTQTKSSIIFDVWENDFDLIEGIEKKINRLYEKYSYSPRYKTKGGKFVDSSVAFSTVKKKRLTTSFFKENLSFDFEKGYVPDWIWTSNEETHWAYIKGLLETDGTVSVSKSKGQPIQLSYSDINIDFLKELQLIFNNLGLQSSIHLLRKGGKTLLPDGKGSQKGYNTKDCYRLIVGNKNDAIIIEEKTGFLSRKKVIIEKACYRDNTKKGYKVKSIEYAGKEDVYCPTVYNDEHVFVSQGIKTFNCTEIIEYSSKDETAVCNLASIALPKMVEIPSGKVREKNKKLRTFNFELLYQVTYQATINLNQVIDVNFYPTPETRNSNMRHRPIGLGVQGLADTFVMMSLPFESEEAMKLNKDIFETIYFAACTASKDLAKKHEPYSSFQGSPASEGILQFDMWNVKEEELSGMWDWKKLKGDIKKYGMRNSLLLAPMPTASCQVVDTQVVTNEGVLSYSSIMSDRNIDWKEIEKTDTPHWITFEKSVSILTMNGYIDTNKMYYNGHKEVYKIEMEDGSTFEATANHKFLINRKNEKIWVRVDELVEDDDIVNIYEKQLA